MRKHAGLERGTLRKRLLRMTAMGICSVMLISNMPAGMTVADAETTTEDSVTDEPTGEPAIAQPQEITLKVASKKYTGDSLKKAKKTFNIGASAMTAISYKVTSGSKYVSVNKNGVVTVKKNTPKGTYKISVTAKATDEYEKAEATVTVTVTKATPELKKTNINWNLKNNKTIKFSTDSVMYNTSKGKFYSSKKSGTVTMKNFKKVSKGNKYKVTFTLEYSLPTNFPQKEINDIVNAIDRTYYFGVTWFWSVYDYQTGEDLLEKNSYNVKTTYGKWKNSGKKKYYSSSGGWYQPAKTSTKKVTITYPKTYKDLCIIAGGKRESDNLKNDVNFFRKGKNDKQYFHGMRVK